MGFPIRLRRGPRRADGLAFRWWLSCCFLLELFGFASWLCVRVCRLIPLSFCLVDFVFTVVADMVGNVLERLLTGWTVMRL